MALKPKCYIAKKKKTADESVDEYHVVRSFRALLVRGANWSKFNFVLISYPCSMEVDSKHFEQLPVNLKKPYRSHGTPGHIPTRALILP